jgi:hypothetical protein
LRPAKIGEHSVADDARNVAAMTSDTSEHCAPIRRQQLSEALSVQSIQMTGRIHHVAEHHAEESVFGRGGIWACHRQAI